MAESTILVRRDLLTGLIRRDYLGKELAQIVVTEACFLVGHPAKVDRPYEMKQEWERGCVCGRQKFA